MKKILILSTLIAITLSSCLKDDKHYTDFASAGNIVNFPNSGIANFGKDAALSDTTVIKVVVDYATASANKALAVTLAVDTTLISKYVAANPGINYIALPANTYTFSSLTVNIAAGAQYNSSTLTIYKNLLDPAKSYMLPVKIANASGVAISANQSVHYYHVIGNDFAGTYQHKFQRYNEADSLGSVSGATFDYSAGVTETFLPVSPTEIQFTTGYGPGLYTYDVTFTKNTDGTYSNFAVSFTAASIAAALPSPTLTQPPVFFDKGVPAGTTLIGPYTYAEALKIFHFQFQAHTSADRYLIDTYKK